MPVNFSRFGVGELRDFMESKGYEDSHSRKKLDLVQQIKDDNLEDELDAFFPEEESEELEAEFQQAEFDRAELEHEIIERHHVGLPNQPAKGSPEWNDFVLKLFTQDEYVDVRVDGGSKTIKGVKCDGLRRVAQLVLGEIVESFAVDSGVNYPDYSITKNVDLVKLQNPPFAWVRYIVAFSGPYGQTIRWGGCADVNFNNTDPKFLPFAFSTAETRAEARALRKALGIKILAAEELTSLDTAASVENITNADWAKGPITDQQISVINNLSRKMKISVYKLINCRKHEDRVVYEGDKRNPSLESLTNEAGIKIIRMLNELQQNKLVKDDTLLEE